MRDTVMSRSTKSREENLTAQTSVRDRPPVPIATRY
jgi:hypothetical protein